MDLSRSPNTTTDIFDLLNPQEKHNDTSTTTTVANKELKQDVLPSYDFQPIRPLTTASSTNNIEPTNTNASVARVWNSADSKPNPSTTNPSCLEADESANFTRGNHRKAYDATILSEIDQTMKKHADILLHSLEGVSARVTQMETRTRNLENLVDDLKVSVENDHGSTDGKLRQLVNILREVQTGVQVLCDKQEIAEAHMQLSKLQVSKGAQQSEVQNTAHTESVQQAASAPQQSHQSLLPQVAPHPPQHVSAAPPNVYPPTQQNSLPVQLPAQVPQSQIPSGSQREHYFPAPGNLQESTHQQYQLPPAQQLQSPTPMQPQHYQSTQFPQYSQASQPPQQHPPVGPVNPSTPQFQPTLSHPRDEIPYMPPQSYPPSIHQSPAAQPHSGGPPSQQYYAPGQMYEPPVSRPSTGFSAGYNPSSGTNFSDSYPYGGPPSQYSSSSMKQPQLPSSPPAPRGGDGSYPRLPTAQILPHALPTASSVGGGSNSNGTGNRVPIDDVVDKVSTMGFSREQVRATVRKLTENGQSVDLNVVLDKLMNDGEIQPQKGWFGR